MSEGSRAIGKRLKRPDSGPKLTGYERYVADSSLSGTLHAGLVLPSHASAFMDDALPHAGDVPTIGAQVHEYPSEHGPFGANGAGKMPSVLPAAAVANAMSRATGVRLRPFPMTPEGIWRDGQPRG